MDAKRITINQNIPLIILNMNGLCMPMKRQRFSEQIKNRTQLFVVYKKSAVNIKTQIA